MSLEQFFSSFQSKQPSQAAQGQARASQTPPTLWGSHPSAALTAVLLKRKHCTQGLTRGPAHCVGKQERSVGKDSARPPPTAHCAATLFNGGTCHAGNMSAQCK